MKHVWRIETADGEGPYALDDPPTGLEDYNDLWSHPNAYNDPGLRDWWGPYPFINAHEEYVFGFKSLAQYRQWFDDPAFRRELANEGFRLNKYEVPNDYVKTSDYQAVFMKDKAKLIETRSPGEA